MNFRYSSPSRIEAFRRLRKEFIAEHKLYTAADLAELVNKNASSEPDKWVSDKRSAGEILGVFDDEIYLYPALQFEELSGQTYPCMKQLIQWFCASQDGWRLAFWLTQPHGMLEGSSPADMLNYEPSRVLQAAQATLVIERT